MLLELQDQLSQVPGGQLRVDFDAPSTALEGDRVLELVALDVEHDLAEHLDEPAVAVPCEPLVAGLRDEPFDRDVVQAEVQDGVHHARHRER